MNAFSNKLMVEAYGEGSEKLRMYYINYIVPMVHKNYTSLNQRSSQY